MSHPKPSDSRFFGLDRPVVIRGCDHPGCAEAGTFKAPKNRQQLHDYYWFCLEHVRAYNEHWDYFEGLKPSEIEAEIKFASLWERETVPLGGLKSAKAWAKAEEALRTKARADFFAEEAAEDVTPVDQDAVAYFPPPARAALAVLGFEIRKGEVVSFSDVKARYKILVKKHHPDANGGSKDAEETFKAINQAFAALKIFFGEMLAA